MSFHRNGRLASATLSRAHECDHELLAPGCLVGFTPGGGLASWTCELAAPRVLLTRGAERECEVELPEGTRVTVEHGKLRTAALCAALTLDGWEFPEHTELVWGDSGALSHATLPVPCTLHGVRWAAGETVVFMFGRIHEGYPDGDGVFQGIPYQGGEVLRFDERGGLARCYLGAECVLSGVPCQAGTRVYLDGEGGLLEGKLARDATLAGVPVAEGSAVALDGRAVLAVTPREDCLVDGLWCAAGSLVALDERGGVWLATLARERVVAGFVAPRGSVLKREADGAPSMLVMTDGRDAEGHTLAGCWTILWDADGRVRRRLPSTEHSSRTSVQLRAEAVIDGLRVAQDTAVVLDADGALRECVLAEGQTVEGLPCRARTRVRLDESGRPQSVLLARDTVIQGVPCARASTLNAVINGVEHTYNETLRLHPDGSVEFATLSDDAVIDGIALSKGHTVSLYANGRLRVGTLAQPWTHPAGCVAAAHTLLGCLEDGSWSYITLAEPFEAHDAGTLLQRTSPDAPVHAEPVTVALGPVTRVDAA